MSTPSNPTTTVATSQHPSSPTNPQTDIKGRAESNATASEKQLLKDLPADVVRLLPKEWSLETGINDPISADDTPLTWALVNSSPAAWLYYSGLDRLAHQRLWSPPPPLSDADIILNTLFNCPTIDLNQKDPKGVLPLARVYAYACEGKFSIMLLRGADPRIPTRDKFHLLAGEKTVLDFTLEGLGQQHEGIVTISMADFKSIKITGSYENVALLRFISYRTLSIVTDHPNVTTIADLTPLLKPLWKVNPLALNNLAQDLVYSFIGDSHTVQDYATIELDRATVRAIQEKGTALIAEYERESEVERQETELQEADTKSAKDRVTEGLQLITRMQDICDAFAIGKDTKYQAELTATAAASPTVACTPTATATATPAPTAVVNAAANLNSPNVSTSSTGMLFQFPQIGADSIKELMSCSNRLFAMEQETGVKNAINTHQENKLNKDRVSESKTDRFKRLATEDKICKTVMGYL